MTLKSLSDWIAATASRAFSDHDAQPRVIDGWLAVRQAALFLGPLLLVAVLALGMTP